VVLGAALEVDDGAALEVDGALEVTGVPAAAGGEVAAALGLPEPAAALGALGVLAGAAGPLGKRLAGRSILAFFGVAFAFDDFLVPLVSAVAASCPLCASKAVGSRPLATAS
jgi:hypothetical protein